MIDTVGARPGIKELPLAVRNLEATVLASLTLTLLFQVNVDILQNRFSPSLPLAF